MSDGVRCGSCGRVFPEGRAALENPRTPCADCGGMTRTVSSSHAAAAQASAAVSVDGTVTFDRTWRAQYRRMRRAFDRLHGVAPATSSFVAVEVEDGYIQFFQDAWALKDWLRNDPTTRAVVTDVERHVNATPALALAADLANGTKHLTLRTTRSGDVATAMGGMTFGGDPTQGLAVSVAIESLGVRHDALDVARNVLTAWDAYLAAKGLTP